MPPPGTAAWLRPLGGAQIMSELGRLARAARAKAPGAPAVGGGPSSALRSSTSAPGAVGGPQGVLGGRSMLDSSSPPSPGRQPPLMAAQSQPEGGVPEAMHMPPPPRGSGEG